MANPKTLFLIDGIGAMISAFSLGVLLPYFELIIGMPRYVLYPLAILASFFALYSFTNYFNFGSNWSSYLKGIAIINMSYCVLSLALIYYFYEQLTVLGLIYFIGEKIIVGSLAWYEWLIANKSISEKTFI